MDKSALEAISINAEKILMGATTLIIHCENLKSNTKDSPALATASRLLSKIQNLQLLVATAELIRYQNFFVNFTCQN